MKHLGMQMGLTEEENSPEWFPLIGSFTHLGPEWVLYLERADKMRKLLSITVYLSFVKVIHSQQQQIHRIMTKKEVQIVFGTNHSNVPEYEIVPIGHTIANSDANSLPRQILRMKSFKRDIRLYLEPTEGTLAGQNIPIWTAESDPSSPSGIKYTRIQKTNKMKNRFYHDVQNLAAFTSSYDEDGKILLHGTIGNDIVVRPLPPRLRKKLSGSKRSVIEKEDLSQFNHTIHQIKLAYTYDHIVFKKKKDVYHKEIPTGRIGSYNLKKKYARSKRASINWNGFIPGTIYPQILVILDYDEYLFLQTVREIKRYVLSFWNAVDLRYRVFLKPNIRLNIVGIIVSKNPGGAPYIQKHLSTITDNPAIDADIALDHMSKYFYNETMDKKLQRFVLEKDFDMAVAMTKLNLCNLEGNGRGKGAYNCLTRGFAYRGGACTVNTDKRLMYSVGIVEDNGGYGGIIPAAHEVGHLMGMPHDGYSEKNKKICSPDDGYLMSGTLILTENVFKWSSCSMEYFYEFFRSKKAECLFDPPTRTKSSVRILPGAITSLDEQCHRVTGTHACNKDESVCVRLECLDPKSRDQCLPIAPAAEGSSCGKSHHCINGKCIDKNSREIRLGYAS
ncbi:hypothetical protein QAD02_016295 [Eretmocerus hayati]|uniref:Uncharacterized protein n=1 Tax=Eretmocerus hayati TaxID=131215 RepID=A0ACC2PBP2_9HYME|nr:hypothetical protein QAD02_016295 [Eretmocerus hayati]